VTSHAVGNSPCVGVTFVTDRAYTVQYCSVLTTDVHTHWTDAFRATDTPDNTAAAAETFPPGVHPYFDLFTLFRLMLSGLTTKTTYIRALGANVSWLATNATKTYLFRDLANPPLDFPE
jgi:hypothetical protein